MTILFGKRRAQRKIGTVGPWVEQLKKQVEMSLAGDVVFDIKGVETVNSEELSAVIHLHLFLAERERRLKLINASPEIEEVFQITRMNRLIEVEAEPRARSEVANALKVAEAAR